MLYLTRKLGETVVINDTIEVTVVEVRRGSAKLGFTFPADATVLRKEISDKIRQENIEAARARAELGAEELEALAAPAAGPGVEAEAGGEPAAKAGPAGEAGKPD